jgi:hypothetical protein
MHRFASVFLVLLAVAAGSVTARAEKRVALVVGNSAYQYTASLANPANDADDMAFALKKVGFDVIEKKTSTSALWKRRWRTLGAPPREPMRRWFITLVTAFSFKASII